MFGERERERPTATDPERIRNGNEANKKLCVSVDGRLRSSQMKLSRSYFGIEKQRCRQCSRTGALLWAFSERRLARVSRSSAVPHLMSRKIRLCGVRASEPGDVSGTNNAFCPLAYFISAAPRAQESCNASCARAHLSARRPHSRNNGN